MDDEEARLEEAKAMDGILQKLRERSKDHLLRYTLPIHVVHGDGNPIAHGSGVLLRIADVPLLLSCAHVLKVASEKGAQLLVPSNDGTPLVVLTAVDFGWTEDERIDLGFAVLPQNVADVLPSSKAFLRLSDLDLDRRHRVGVYSVLGYPVETTDRDLVGSSIDSRPAAFTGYLFDGTVQDHIDGVTIALMYERNAIGNSAGERARPPGSWKGISGCGIWRLAAMDIPAPARWIPEEHVKLVGIEHEVLSNAIKGSHIAELISIVKRELPNLAPTIELHEQDVASKA